MKSRLLTGLVTTISLVINGLLGAVESDNDVTNEIPNFGTVFSRATIKLKHASDIKIELEVAIRRKHPAEEIDKLQADYSQELNAAANNYERALSLANMDDDNRDVTMAQYHLAHTYYRLGKNYEAAVLAGHVARIADDGTLGLDAAYLAMAALVRADNENKSPFEQKGEDLQLIVKACKLITDRWPSSDKAIETHLLLGRIYSRQKKPILAAESFEKVPPSDSKYPVAQISAGQAYWSAYLAATRLRGAEKATWNQLNGVMKSAQEHVLIGIHAMPNADEGTAPLELIAAKMSLAEIMIAQNMYSETLQLLLKDPHSIVGATSVADEAKRPATGVKSRTFAIEAHKLLLRTYFGTGNRDKARETLKSLETITAAGGEAERADLDELISAIEKVVRHQLEQLRANSETKKFEALEMELNAFLNELSNRKKP